MANEESTYSSVNDQKKKNIVVIPINSVGHVNGCRGATSHLVKNNKFRVYFLLEKAFQGQLEPLGYEEVIYDVQADVSNVETNNSMKPGEKWGEEFSKYQILGNFSMEEKLKNLVRLSDDIEIFFKAYQQIDKCLRELSQKIRIDLFIVDELNPHPFVHYSDIPLIRCVTSTPSNYMIDNEDLPPPWTGWFALDKVSVLIFLHIPIGLPSDSDRKDYQYYWDIYKKQFEPEEFNKMLTKLGYPKFDQNLLKTIEARCALTVYAYPKELNWPKIENRPGWLNLEVFNKNQKATKIDLEKLVGQRLYNDDLDGRFSGKWIYLSLGSFGSADVQVMRRLVATLAKTKHKFIVSKGPRHQEYDLARNMWGARFVPQMEIIPIVDLVITHGGNNSFTETFAQGKRMLVLPLFADQFDNAQRLVETNYGVRIDPNDYQDDELISTIDKLLDDEDLKQKLHKISQRIQTSEGHQIFEKMVEKIIEENSNDS